MKTVCLRAATSKQAVPWGRTAREAELGEPRVGSRQLARSRLGDQWADTGPALPWGCPAPQCPSSSVRLELVTPSPRAAGWTHVWEEPGVVSISSQECPSF